MLTWGQRGTTTLATLVLASLLGPRNYGLVGMALVYLSFLQLFLEQGIAHAVIQREDLVVDDIDAAFWMNVGWSVVLATVSVLVSGPWARFTRVPELAPVINALSLTLVIRGLTVVQEALAQRELRFRALALRSNVAAVIGASVGIGAALLGAGVWSLVLQQLALALASLVLLWSLATWRPRLRFSAVHARRIVGFSAQVFAGHLGVFLQGRIDEMLLGVFFGPRAVGLYRLADRMMEVALQLANRPMQVITFAHLARLQEDPVALRDTVRDFLRTTSMLSVPALLVVAAVADRAVAVVGPEWTAAAPALRLLCLAGIARAAMSFTGPLLMATAQPRRRALMIWGLAVVSVPLFLGAAWSLRALPVEQQVVGMAAATALISLLLFLPVSFAMMLRVSGLTARALVPTVTPSLLSGIGAVLAVTIATQSGMLDPMAGHPVWALGAAGAIAVAAAVGILLGLERDLRLRARGLLVGRT